MSERSVVVSLPGSGNAFQQMQAEDALQTARRLGLDLTMCEADRNAVLQIQQIFKFIHAQEPPRALVVEPVSLGGIERLVQKAVAAGIGVGLLNCTAGSVASLRAQHPALAIFMLGSDQAEIGRLQGQQIRRLLPAGGTVLYIQGPLEANAARERAGGTQEALVGARVELIQLDALWTEESADKAVQKWLRLRSTQGKRVDLVAGQNDAIARGARLAAEAVPEVTRSWGVVPFLGIDGVPAEGQRLVEQGALTATIVMPSNTGPALAAIDGWLRSGVPPKASIQAPVRSFPPEERLAPRR